MSKHPPSVVFCLSLGVSSASPVSFTRKLAVFSMCSVWGVYVLVCVCVCDVVRLALILNTVQYWSYSCKAVNHVSVLNDNKEQLPGESGTTRCRKYITGASKGEKWVSWDHFWNRDYILFLRRDMLKSITQMKVKCYSLRQTIIFSNSTPRFHIVKLHTEILIMKTKL